MITKKPQYTSRKWLKRGAITLFVLEAAGFIFSYKIWTKVNTERESRKYLRDNYPSLLEAYYRAGEYLDSNNKIRQVDTAYWNTTLTGTGYGLYVGITPSEQKIDKFKKEFAGAKQSTSEVRSKNQQFLDILHSAAATDKPIYRMSKEERENLRK